MEAGEKELVLSWFEANKNWVNYVNLDMAGYQSACLKNLKNYFGDDDTPRSMHLRL